MRPRIATVMSCTLDTPPRPLLTQGRPACLMNLYCMMMLGQPARMHKEEHDLYNLSPTANQQPYFAIEEFHANASLSFLPLANPVPLSSDFILYHICLLAWSPLDANPSPPPPSPLPPFLTAIWDGLLMAIAAELSGGTTCSLTFGLMAMQVKTVRRWSILIRYIPHLHCLLQPYPI